MTRKAESGNSNGNARCDRGCCAPGRRAVRGREIAREAYGAHNMMYLGPIQHDDSLIHSKVPISSFEDFRGKRIRVPGGIIADIEAKEEREKMKSGGTMKEKLLNALEEWQEGPFKKLVGYGNPTPVSMIGHFRKLIEATL